MSDLSYESAKELRDVGFEVPKKWRGEWRHFEVDENNVAFLNKEEREEKAVYIPTLSELIEACGLGFAHLSRKPDESWEASSVAIAKKGVMPYLIEEIAKTPEEAVKNLWLKLNGKT